MRGSRARERQAVEEAKKRAEADERQRRRAHRQAVADLVAALGETEAKSQATLERSVTALGIAEAQALLAEVQRIEAEGGLLTADGSRRRTPGGVYMFLLKQRLTEAGKKDLLKQIMAG